MKLILKKQKNEKDFCNELLFVSAKYKNLVKNPRIKIHKVTSIYVLYIPIGVLIIAALIYLMLKYKVWLLILLLIQMFIFLFVSLYYVYDSLKFIKKEATSDINSEITINNSGVRLTKGKNIDYRINWKDIAYIIINKNVLVFLPKEKTKLIIGINSYYKDEVIKMIKDERREDLIIDNTK